MKKAYLFLVSAAIIVLSATIVFFYNNTSTEPPKNFTYEIIQTFPHDSSAFTQGLVFDEGFLYESTGLFGSSSLRQVELETGNVLRLRRISDVYFAEGIAIVGDRIIQLTWLSRIGFVYDKSSFDLLQNFSYPTEGWGITYDGTRLIMSDGTANLYFLDPLSFEIVGQIEVHDEDTVDNLNELEYIEDKIYANIWRQEKIIIINPKNGQIESWIDLSGIYDLESEDPNNVLNGIAYDAIERRLFVTGKRWSQLFEIRLRPTE